MQDWEGFAIETQLSFVFGIVATALGVVLLSDLRMPKMSETRPENT